MTNERVIVELTEEQRDWLIDFLRKQLEYADDWDSDTNEADELLDMLLLTKGQRRYTVTAQSETSIVVEAADEIVARAVAEERLVDSRKARWTVQSVQEESKP